VRDDLAGLDNNVRRWLPNQQAAKIAGMSSWPNSAMFNTATAPKLSARTRDSSSSPLDKDRNDADLSAVQPDGQCVQAAHSEFPSLCCSMEWCLAFGHTAAGTA
jgi:hypothetical protein